MGIGKRIKALRSERGLTQEALALKIGVTPSAVGNYEHDVSFPREEVLMRLFGALGCTPNELLGDDEPSGIEERAHLNKYRVLDALGKRRVDSVTETELMRVCGESEEIAVAARNGSGSKPLTLKKRSGKNLLDMPDYGGRRK